MKIDIYPGSVLGSEIQCIEQLQNGSLSMTKISAAAMENFVPTTAVFGLPYVFRDQTHLWSVLTGPIGEELLLAGEDKYLRGLCYYDAGSRNLYTKTKPVRSPDDLRGLKIRVMNSATAIDMVKSIGGSPTPISFGELYSALAQGTVDGAENNFPSFVSNKHYEVCKHFTLDGHTRVPDILMISTRAWDRLDDRQRGWLRDAAAGSSEYQRQLWLKETELARQKAIDEGVQIYDVRSRAFADKVRPMIGKIDNDAIKQLIHRIAEVR